MRREPPKTALDYAPLAFPAGMLILFFVVPFATMIAVSFFRRDPAGFYSPISSSTTTPASCRSSSGACSAFR